MECAKKASERIGCRMIGNSVGYPLTPPYHPSQSYPEYTGEISAERNDAYEAVRGALQLLGYDAENFGKPEWNPLKTVIHKGETVLIKPNLGNQRNFGKGSIWSVITHPSVIRAVVDYVYRALEGTGRILIADAPAGYVRFSEILAMTQLETIAAYYESAYGFPIEILDLREQSSASTANGSCGDPLGYTVFDLAEESCFRDIENADRIADAARVQEEALRHHSGGHHEYGIANSILAADVVISVPKLKMHNRTGVSLNLKNFVGACADKRYLPHYRVGTVSDGGDQSAPFFGEELGSANKLLFRAARKLHYTFCRRYRGERDIGAWYGNDTAWRMVLDIDRIVAYGGTDGQLNDVRRRFFCVMDGIVAGEGEGPLSPKDRLCGLVIAGEDLLAADLAALRMMGIDWKSMPLYRRLAERIRRAEKDFALLGNDFEGLSLADDGRRWFSLREPYGWIGYMKKKA